MIELNLLPDVKLEYIKAQRYRRLVFGVAFLATGASVALLILLFSFGAFQKKHLNDLSKDINSHVTELKNKPQIDKILTVQNQLQSLTALHAGKPAASHLLDYLNQLTPVQANITEFKVDFTTQTATITGTADALKSVNTYVDTLKFTTYSVASSDSASSTSSTSAKAFSNVVLTSFSLTSDNKDTAPATYTIDLAYDKAIFDIAQTIQLSVPQQVTTRSQLSSPSALFQAVPDTKKGSN